MRLFQFVFVTAVAALLGVATHAASLPQSSTIVESTFAGYVSFQEQTAGRWRELNEEMGRVGGHVGHLRALPPVTSELSPESRPAAPDHDAHHPTK